MIEMLSKRIRGFSGNCRLEPPSGRIKFDSAVVIVPASIIARIPSSALSREKRCLRDIRPQVQSMCAFSFGGFDWGKAETFADSVGNNVIVYFSTRDCEAGADTLKSGMLERVLSAG